MSDIEEDIDDLEIEEEPEVEEEPEIEEDEEESEPTPFVSKQSKINLFKKEVVIAPEKRRTSNIMSLTEMTEAVSIRAEQISKNPITLLKDIEDLSDPIDIAKREIDHKLCPLILRRVIGTTIDPFGVITEHIEYWDVNKMAKSIVYGV